MNKFTEFFKKHFTKKRMIWGSLALILILAIIYFVTKGQNVASKIQTDTVKKQDIKLTVLTTGQVVSSTDLNLGFKVSGNVQSIKVKEGDKVTTGQILATLSQSDQVATLTQARGALASANANYQKVLAGASSEDVALSQAALDAAHATLAGAKKNLTDVQAQQETLVNNAYNTLINTGLDAIKNFNTLSSLNITVTGNYTGSAQGQYKIRIQGSGTFFSFVATSPDGVDLVGPNVIANVPYSIGNGLYITFSSITQVYGNEAWTIDIPNTHSPSYIANLNAYNAALQTKQTAITTAENAVTTAQGNYDQAAATLNLKRAQARPADVAAAQAQILSAEGQVQAASASLENTIIRAPANGTITSVDVKVGELAPAQQEVIVLQDISNLHVEADVSEANIAQLKPDQSVDLTFDALGPTRTFQGKIQSINPGATVVSGVVNYKVTVGVDNIADIKPGMTANMTILVAQKQGVLTVPQRAVITHDSKNFVRIIDDPIKKTYHEVEVQTGLEADGGIDEVTSGLTEGQTIVTFISA